MKIKTSELIGSALDWAVAKCEGYEDKDFCLDDKYFRDEDDVWYSPSTDWSQGGPIIEREGIALLPPELAEMPGYEGRGETLLIAAMRCYVTSKLGDEIEVPEDLNKEQA
jgi:hypothetical protein